MRYLGSAIAWLALWLGAWAGARAQPMPDPAFALELRGDVPFTRAELDDALLPRLRDASIEIRAAAHGATAQVIAQDRGVHVQIGPRQRIVPLGERTGTAAARVVALVVLDLVPAEGPALPMPLIPMPAAGDDADLDMTSDAAPMAVSGAATARELAYEQQRPMPPPPPPPLPRQPAAAPAAPASAPHLAARQTTARDGMARPAAMSVRVSAFGGVVRGATSEQAGLYSAGADARVGLGAWRVGGGAAWVHLPATDHGQTELGLHGVSLRAEAGRLLGSVEVMAAGFVVPYRLHADVDGDASPLATHDGVLLGGGVAARVAAELGRGWRLQATAGIDVFGRRLRVRTPDEVLASTPLVALTINVGLGWEVLP